MLTSFPVLLKVRYRGRLGPGEMIAVDLEKGVFLNHKQIQKDVAGRHPYGKWLKDEARPIPYQPFNMQPESGYDDQQLLLEQTRFGWGLEDCDMIIADMASTGKESTYCMGDDIPLAALSGRPHVLYDYFKQRFAQVTNPPIDPLREGTVMSLHMSLGRKGNVLKPKAENARLLRLESPIVNEAELRMIYDSDFRTTKLDTTYALADGPKGLKAALDRLGDAAVKAVRSGAEVLVLSDRAEGGLGTELTYIPPMLATGAVHHRLISEGLRMQASLLVETGQAWSTHHLACLIGYGASAVHPYLAIEATKDWHRATKTQALMASGGLPNITLEKALSNMREALEAGLLKIMSKMGISLLESYQGAQIFEAIGIGEDLLEAGFRGTPSRVGGLTIEELAQEVGAFAAKALPKEEGATLKKLENYGFNKFIVKGEVRETAASSRHTACPAGLLTGLGLAG